MAKENYLNRKTKEKGTEKIVNKNNNSRINK